jgi:ATP-binding cassette, subfamily C, bacterial CydCD
VRYSDGRVALEDISFEIKAGSRTALVGASGAGKSTIAWLMLRFIEPYRGEIQVDGVPVGGIPAETWRERIAWVSQDSFLFNDSVEANIRLGRPQASQDEVEQAAKLANAHDFILELPNGYATEIGERGARLSAGQAQRIALARAFLKDAPTLILDEPSAHLDPENEALIMDAVERLMSGRTTLVIAHRLNTIYQSDQIILLKEGRVEASGTHEELLAFSETYHRLVIPTSREDDEIKPEILSMSLPCEAGSEVPVPGQFIEQGETPAKKAQAFDTLRRLIGYLLPYKWRAALSILLGWATISSGIGLMATSAFIIASAALHPPIAELQVAIVGVRAFGISRGVFRYLERLVSHDLTMRILANLRGWLYQAIEPLAPARLSTFRSGDLLKRMTGDITSLESLYVRGIAPLLVAVLVAVSSAIFLNNFSFGLSIIFMVFLIAAGVCLPWIVQQVSQRAGREIIHLQGKMSAAIVDGLQGLPELLSFGAAWRYQDQVAEIQRKLAIAQTKLGLISSVQTGALGLLAHLATLAVLSTAIGLSGAGQLDGLYLGVIALLVLTSFEALQPLPQAAQVLGSNLEAAGRLFAIADMPLPVSDPATPCDVPEHWELKVFELCFSYPAEGDIPGGPVLEGISFDLPYGKHMAIVGPSGAGKSTVVRLLTRSWDYQEGSILLNDNELSQYAGEDLRKKIAAVPQNPYLFTATILENLQIARPQASMDEIFQSARLAQIHDFIESLPQGYHTWVGEHGLRLSAGERQRIAVARALLMDATLLILDEATANLDALTERTLLAGIREARQGRSLLVITHRLIGMEDLDEILVLERGRIVQRGMSAELLSTGGLYRRMWEAQHRM